MRKTLRLVLSAIVLTTGLAGMARLVSVAEAAQPPRVNGYACRTLAAQRATSQIWWSQFQGQRQGLFDRWTWRRTRCFRSLSNCKAWLYWAQTDYPEMIIYTPCRRGLPWR